MSKDMPLDIITPFVPVPTLLIDQIMPTLKDTEWRLLCVIVRQTLGWSTNGQERKARDWLSQRQLIERTGRNSAALSAALDALVKRQLVEAWDQKGYPLLTPQERRRHRGRVYLGLNPKTLGCLTKEISEKRRASEVSIKTPSGTLCEMQPPFPSWTAARTSGWSKANDINTTRYKSEIASD